MTQVESLAKYAAPRYFCRPLGRIAQAIANPYSDSGCCTPPWEPVRSAPAAAGFPEFGGMGPSPPIGGGQANPVDLRCVLAHSTRALCRRRTTSWCRPRRAIRQITSAARPPPSMGAAAGKDSMLWAAGLHGQSRFVDHADFSTSGFDHTSQLACTTLLPVA